VLSMADLLVTYSDQPEFLQGLLEGYAPAGRLGLVAGCAQLLADSAAELVALRDALAT